MSEILIQCVVVLYQCNLENSATLGSLAEFGLQQRDFARRVALLIYDNSPEPQPSISDRWNLGAFEYCHASKNEGLAAAYNHALLMAHEADVKWLLLLDQDTVLQPTLFEALFAVIESPLSPKVCAIVPRLIQDGRMLSPQRVGRFRNHDYPEAGESACHTPITAFNSAACVRVQSLEAIGGFPGEYWLDYLDHVVFHRLQAAGGRVLVLDVVMKHRLSLRNLETEMSLDRYANLLASEWRFVRETGSGGGPLIHRLRLLKRALSHSVRLKNKAYASKTLRAVLE